jgi:hypothetical protein
MQSVIVSLNSFKRLLRLTELHQKKRGRRRRDSPGPCLLGLEQDGDGRVVETREEDEIDNIPDVLIHTYGKIEDKTGGIRYIPARSEPNGDYLQCIKRTLL